jgi:dolichol-phosphate mannosyltransferase
MVPAGAELTVVIPTYNERGNVREVVRRLHECLEGRSWEVLFVDDDSTDGTAEEVRRIAREDGRVRCIHRIGRRGLSSACIEGMLATAAPLLAVMDGDLQHDETLLPRMLDALENEKLDLVVGSRYVEGGGLGEWNEGRIRISRFAGSLSKVVTRVELTDPMSGFFMLRREVFEAAVRDLSGIGFKILLDIFASSPRKLEFQELPYEFRTRQAGASKLDAEAAWSYLILLLDKLFGNLMPVRLITFLLVGGFGIGVHLAAFTVLFKGLGQGFVASQVVATLVAMVSNFTLNNLLTYRDVRLRGWRWAWGLLTFIVACGMGAIANVSLAAYLFEMKLQWTLSAFSGIVVSTVWNYAVTSLYTWGSPKPGRKRK